jgi:hypothetical protein
MIVKNKKIIGIVAAVILTVVVLVLPTVILAGSVVYQPLAPIPTLGIPSSMTLGAEDGLTKYLDSWVKLLIQVATGLAVLYMVFGGVKYTLSDSFSSKSEAKATIGRALGGLVLALLSYLLLNTINPLLLTGKIKTLADLSVAPVSGGGAGTQSPIEAIPPGGTSSSTTGGVVVDPTTGRITNNNLTRWGDPTARTMQGQVIPGRQTYYAIGETNSDSSTDAGKSAVGFLIEGTPTVVGSAASVYYPAGTLIRTNGITYVIDDNNIDGRTGKPANNVLTNNYTIDIFTSNKALANGTVSKPNTNLEILYVPPTKQGPAGVKDIRNNPQNYIGK